MGNETKKEQWDRYYKELEIHDTQMAITKPLETDFDSQGDYLIAYQEWKFRYNIDAPTRPTE